VSNFFSILLNLSKCEKEKNKINNYIENIKIPVKFNENEILNKKDWLIYKKGWELYNYQKNDILFMENIENGITGLNLKVYESSGFYTFENRNFNLQGRYFNKEYPLFYEKLNLKGGCLINEMGLGKTLEIYELISKTKSIFNDNFKLVKCIDGYCNYFFKRGKNVSNSCCKKSIEDSYFCKVHSNSVFIDKMKTYVENEDNFKSYLKDKLNETDMIEKIRFKSNCTLIICPTQLCDQWCREFYEKYKDSNLLISMISTIDTFNNTTFAELLLLDVLIIPYTLFENINYLSIREKSKKYKMELINEWNNKYESIFWDIKDRELFVKDLNLTELKKNITLSNIKFKRIVLDEFHEITSVNLLNILNNLESDFKWVVTGTPFLNEEKSIRQYINFLTDDKLYNYEINYSEIPKIFKRNTKESIKNEWSSPKIETTCNLINFTQIESTIYRSYKEQLRVEYQRNNKNIIMNLLKMCCCGDLLDNLKLKINKCKTFEEVQKVILDENENTLNELFIKISDLENEIKVFEEMGKNNEISNKKRNLTNLRKEYDSINRGQLYLKTVINSINDKEEWECAICLEQSEDIVEIGITKCGHKFCWECLLFSAENSKKYSNIVSCPQCKCKLSEDEYFLIKNEEEEKNEETCELSKLIEMTKSSKIGNIINYLKTSLKRDDYCIIFSQWDSLLKKVGDYIEKSDLSVVYCSGTIYQKRTSMNKFNEGDTRIIMLSSENSASGLNLTKANKIIFIEPVYGTQIRKIDVENQAIGRANRIGQKNNIEVIKFIIKDTIEEEILNGKEVGAEPPTTPYNF
jgi:SNF2 family DNA or RNA helicase